MPLPRLCRRVPGHGLDQNGGYFDMEYFRPTVLRTLFVKELYFLSD